MDNAMEVKQVGSTLVVEVDASNPPREDFLEIAIKALLTDRMRYVQLKIFNTAIDCPGATKPCKFATKPCKLAEIERRDNTIVVGVNASGLPERSFLEVIINASLTSKIKIIQLEIADVMDDYPGTIEICNLTNENATVASVLERLEKYNLPS